MTAQYVDTHVSTTDAGTFYSLADGDTLYVTRNGSIATLGSGSSYAFPVTADGTAVITIEGSVYSSNAIAITLRGTDYVTIGSSGYVAGYDGIGFYGATGTLSNAGLISATRTGTDLAACLLVASGHLDATNTGQIFASGGASGIGVIYSSSTPTLSLINSGTISAANGSGILLGSSIGTNTIVNTGTIQSSGTGNVAIALGSGADSVTNSGTLIGDVMLGDGADVFDGRLGNLQGTLLGGTGNDTLYGSSTADDVIDGGAGADYINGGGGNDTASYADAAGGLYVSLMSNAANAGDAAGDRLIGIENLTGSGYADTLIANAGDNVVDGGAGNDIIYGGTGNDTFIGGADTDTLTYSNAAIGVTVTLASTLQQQVTANDTATISGFENLTGSGFADTLTGDTGANQITGGGGNDIIAGGDGNDTIIGGAGDDKLDGGIGTDTASYGDATSGVTVSLLLTTAQNTQGAGTDTLTGFESLSGSNYNDTLTGDANVNLLNGRSGIDRLAGGLGNDILYGGAGADTFVMDTALGSTNVDSVMDFTVGDGDGFALSRSVFTVLATGALSSSAFVTGSAAATPDQHIVYNSATGDIFYDADGSGSGTAVRFARVTAGTALTNASFSVFG